MMILQFSNQDTCEWKRNEKWAPEDEIDSITDSIDMNLSELQEDRGTWHAEVHGVTKSWM